jgi:hypothetical protein
MMRLMLIVAVVLLAVPAAAQSARDAIGEPEAIALALSNVPQ